MTRELLSRSADTFEHVLLTWPNNHPSPYGVETVSLEHGDLQAIATLLGTAEVVLVMTSFNVRALAWLVTDILHGKPTPVVTVVHTSSNSNPDSTITKQQHDTLQRLIHRSTTTVAVAPVVAEQLNAQFPATGHIVVIPNAARTLPPSENPQRSRGRTNVAYIGRPHPQKGFSEFIRLARELAHTGLVFKANTVSIHVATDEAITCSAHLSDKALRRFFDDADVLIAPYLAADGMPLALLEAMACGLPIIGYDSPGVGDLLRQHNQFVIPPNYTALSETVRAWRDNDLQLHPPEATHVPNWDAAADYYSDIIRDAAHARN